MMSEARIGSVHALGVFDNRFALGEKSRDGESHRDAVVVDHAEPGRIERRLHRADQLHV